VFGTGHFGDRMNTLPKLGVLTTLKELEWNNSHLFMWNIAVVFAKLKQQPGQDILLSGSCELVHTLMNHDLIDEYRLMVHPVVLGGGKRLFRDGDDKAVLKLVDTKSFSSGVVVLSYQPAGKQEKK